MMASGDPEKKKPHKKSIEWIHEATVLGKVSHLPRFVRR